MRKIKGLRWYMIALVTLGTVLGYLTRNTVAAAAPTLMEELNISTQQYSYIIAAYSAAYTVMQPVAGYVLDVLGTKIGYAMFAVLWAVFCGATALAGSWGGLAVARGAVGAAEAAMIPAGLKASSEWFPAKERSIAVGYFNVGSSIGAMIAPPLVVWAIVMHSWQMAFIISGALSFIWAMAWLIFYKHPRDQKHLTDEERDYIINGQEAQHQVVPPVAANLERRAPPQRAGPEEEGRDPHAKEDQPGRAQHRRADAHEEERPAPDGGEHTGERQADPERPAEIGGEQRVGIGAHGIEGDIAEIDPELVLGARPARRKKRELKSEKHRPKTPAAPQSCKCVRTTFHLKIIRKTLLRRQCGNHKRLLRRPRLRASRPCAIIQRL